MSRKRDERQIVINIGRGSQVAIGNYARQTMISSGLDVEDLADFLRMWREALDGPARLRDHEALVAEERLDIIVRELRSGEPDPSVIARAGRILGGLAEEVAGESIYRGIVAAARALGFL